MKKRILSMLLALAMVLGLMPNLGLTAQAAEINVASVTVGSETTNYADIASAVTAAQASEGSTLTLLDNITCDGQLTINNSVTLDLNGKTLTATGDSFGVSVNGDLTVTDSSADKNGKLFGTSTNAYRGYGVYATGSITVKGGEVTGKATGTESYGVYADENISDASECDITVSENGTLTGEGIYSGVFVKNGNITVESGSLTGTATSSHGIQVSGSITVNGGSLAGTGSTGVFVKGGIAVNGGNLTAIGTNSTGIYAGGGITMTGGELTGTGGWGVHADDSITVDGGSITGRSTRENGIGVYVKGSITVKGGELTGTTISEDIGTENYGVYVINSIAIENDGKLTGTGVPAIRIFEEADSSYKVASETSENGLTTKVLVANSVTHTVRILAVNANDDEWELAGAHLQILNADGDVVVVNGSKMEWDSDVTAHTVTGLNTGVTYTLRATVAPDGYTVANDVTFSINETGSVITSGDTAVNGTLLVKFANTAVQISAVDAANDAALAGAYLQILTVNKQGQERVVDEAVSTEEVWTVTGLKTGVEYILRATVAPRGYTVPADTTFTLDYDGKISGGATQSQNGVLLVEFDKTVVQISAVDAANGEAVEGAHLQILDKDGNLIDEWVSAVDDEETTAVDESMHMIYGLKTGETYIISTTVAPGGYTVSDDVTFYISGDGQPVTTGSMTEDGVLLVVFDLTKVEIKAVDASNGEGITGATMQILDARSNVVEKWVSAADIETTEDVDESVHTVVGLNTGETFTLHTTVAPDGYTVPADTTFSIDENGKITTTGSLTEDGILLAEFESAVTTYPLYVGMQQFTENLLTITDSNGGTATYDPQTHTLTLNNFTYSGTGVGYTSERAAIFYYGKETLTLHLVGKSSITYSGNTPGNNYGFYADRADVIFSGTGDLTSSGGEAEWVSGGIFVYHDLTLSGTGKLNVIGKNGGGISYGIYCAEALTISDGTVNITTGEAQDSIGIRGTYGAISVDGGSLNITCGNASSLNFGIYTVDGDFVCSDGTVTVTSGNAPSHSYGIYTTNGDFVLSDGTVTVNSGICGTDEGGYSCGIVAQNILVRGGHLTAVSSTAATSVGIYASETATLYGGVLEAAGQTQALNMAPTVDSGFANAAVWYGDNAAAASEAKPIGDLANNYSQKYVKVAASEPDTYTVTVRESENGTVTADKTTAAEGETVTITVTPDSGKQVDQVTVKDASGKDVPFTDNGDGTYTYEQPAGDVEIEVTMKETEYENEIIQPEGGKVETDNPNPTMGDKVTITVDPNPGKRVDEVIVKDQDGNPVEVTRNPDGTYSYEQPIGDVTIEVIFEDIPRDPTYRPTIEDTVGGDTTVSDKYPEKGDKVTITTDPDKGYEVGKVTVTDSKGNPVKVTDNGDGTYTYIQPAGKVTITVTYVPERTDFVDVSRSSYYYNAVNWAVANGITNGTSATTFSPNAVCTRAQVVTFLWRAAGEPAPRSNAMPFTDVAEGAYYYDAVLWAVENGITNGMSATAFAPNAECTRGQIVTFLWRSQGAPESSGSIRFTDVDANAYYGAAVVWAVRNDITNGTGDNTFSPDAKCTRAQIVTFLYRCMAE